MIRFFTRLAAGHFARHRLEALLCLAGIVLGVAVVIAIDSAVLACIGSFRGAVGSLAERSTHSLFADRGTIPDETYIALRRRIHDIPLAPVIDRAILVRRIGAGESGGGGGNSNSDGHAPVVGRLIGIDPFSERSFRSFTQMQSSLDRATFERFMTEPGKVVLVDALAKQIGASAGDTIEITSGSRRVMAEVIGVVGIAGAARSQLTDLVTADLATAQELAGTLGAIDRIDVHLGSAEQETALRGELPAGLVLRSTRQREESLSDLIASYKLNLNALSLMASFVAVFIVYNSMLISVRQRAKSLGILRCLGASRSQLAGIYVVEAGALSFAGGAIGVVAGWGLSQILVGAVATTINDIYAAVRPAAPPLDGLMFAKGLAISMASGMVGACVPLWQAARTPPIGAFQTTVQSKDSGRAATGLAVAGAGLLALAAGVYFIPGGSAVAGFVIAFFVALGFAFLCPLATRGACRVTERLARPAQSLSVQMAGAGARRSLGITGVAVAAMMLAMAMNISIRTMVSSFRGALSSWVNQRFAADVFVGPELLVNHRVDAALDPEVVRWVRSQPEVRSVIAYRLSTLTLGGKPTALSATDAGALLAARTLPIQRIDRDREFDPAKDCLISEPLAGRMHLGLGDVLELPAPRGSLRLSVHAIFYDFGSERGQVMIDRQTYASAFADDATTSLHVSLNPGVDGGATAARWSQTLRKNYPVVASSFAQVKSEVMSVFDRTFKVTVVLSWLAGSVAFCGLAGSLLALALARQQDYSVLAAIGMSGRQMALWVLAQGMILAWVSAGIASIAGTALAYVLSNVIQYRSFGWSIPTSPRPGYWFEALVSATLAAIVAAIYPVYRLRHTPPAGTLRQQ